MSDQSTLSEFDGFDTDEAAESDVVDDKLYRNEEWLRKQYVENGLSQSEIADKVSVGRGAVGNWMRKYDIETRSPAEWSANGDVEPLKDEEWLREQYCEQGMVLSEIAELIGVTAGTVSNWIHRHGIETRLRSESMTDGDVGLLSDEGWLREQYLEREKTLSEIAESTGVTTATVSNWMKRHDIETQSPTEWMTDGDVELLKDEEWLREQYLEQEKPPSEIADELNLSPGTVRNWVERYGINARSQSESQADGDINQLEDGEWLREQYCEQEKSQAEIADELNLSQVTVGRFMQMHEIEARALAEERADGNLEPLKDEEWLRDQYCEQQKSIRKIADELGLSQTPIKNWLNKHDIEFRSLLQHPEHLSHRVLGELELEVANRLHDIGVDYEYESLEIEYDDGRRYIPDFATEDYVIECKGRDWGKAFDKGYTAKDKAEAAMRQLDDREYVVVGEQLPSDIHIPRGEYKKLRELIE
ncbi:helix-turn-helix domain-containing protein [Halonotius pteroides]|uniref:Uncharacterized protein n=1 Tax=Halonotius pteroides TaxID=268735 RepID=A0A3A6QJX5_9EURY|nr:helix-turn-helix domain-containing protein [Halonotius pteroides]RJX47522.1 hypothetical protein DP106_14710 [Halonotius pteroides]